MTAPASSAAKHNVGLKGIRARSRKHNSSSSTPSIEEDSAQLKRARQQADTTDHYSALILEDLMRKRNVASAPSEAAESPVVPSASTPVLPRLKVRGSDSVGSHSTVSTIGLLLEHKGFTGQEDVHRNPLQSPRSRFIAGCFAQKLNPRASLLVRKNLSKQLNLQHLGMGDALAALLAECLSTLPYVQSINIADNMLTDAGTLLMTVAMS